MLADKHGEILGSFSRMADMKRDQAQMQTSIAQLRKALTEHRS